MFVRSMGDNSPYSQNIINTEPSTTFHAKHLLCLVLINKSYWKNYSVLLSTHIGVDYVVISFDMDVQPLATHNAAWPLCVRAIYIDIVSNHLLFAHMPWALLAKMSWASISYSHKGSWALFAQMSWAVIWNSAESHMVSQEQGSNEWMNDLILWSFDCISIKEWNETRPSHPCLKSTNGDFSIVFWDVQWFI